MQYCFIPANSCPSGWSYLASERMCFFKETSALNFNDALKACAAKGGNLASITSEDQQEFIKGMIMLPEGKYIAGP